MYKLSFYVPVSHAEQLKQAVFEQGAGRIGDYDSCAWQVLGEGQFRPLAGSEPYLGSIGKIEQVAEYKIEMVCADDLIKTVVQTLLACHPYQQPAYEVYKILSIADLS
ncbi:NGG1p interacting factor NIF3 [Methylomonas sp. TEB]|uniref:NGG1p interacting factor NIF3 n=1 Tax=Methylomonas sp. TEB TaxID=3398229 RepID=UPI0039F47E06